MVADCDSEKSSQGKSTEVKKKKKCQGSQECPETHGKRRNDILQYTAQTRRRSKNEKLL